MFGVSAVRAQSDGTIRGVCVALAGGLGEDLVVDGDVVLLDTMVLGMLIVEASCGT